MKSTEWKALVEALTELAPPRVRGVAVSPDTLVDARGIRDELLRDWLLVGSVACLKAPGGPHDPSTFYLRAYAFLFHPQLDELSECRLEGWTRQQDGSIRHVVTDVPPESTPVADEESGCLGLYRTYHGDRLTLAIYALGEPNKPTWYGDSPSSRCCVELLERARLALKEWHTAQRASTARPPVSPDPGAQGEAHQGRLNARVPRRRRSTKDHSRPGRRKRSSPLRLVLEELPKGSREPKNVVAQLRGVGQFVGLTLHLGMAQLFFFSLLFKSKRWHTTAGVSYRLISLTEAARELERWTAKRLLRRRAAKEGAEADTARVRVSKLWSQLRVQLRKESRGKALRDDFLWRGRLGADDELHYGVRLVRGEARSDISNAIEVAQRRQAKAPGALAQPK